MSYNSYKMLMRNLKILLVSFWIHFYSAQVSAQHNVSNEVASVEISFKTGQGALIDTKKLNLTGCISPVPQAGNVKATIDNILVLSGCVNLYRRLDCKGDFISKTFGLKVDWQSWDIYYQIVYSIGLCSQELSQDKIDPSWPLDTTPFFTIVEKDSMVTLAINECNVLPISGQTEKFIYFNNTICIELHEEENCTGRSVKFRQLTSPRKLNMTWERNTVKSVSQCTYSNDINGSEVEFNLTSIGPGVVTLFEEENFQGGYRHVNISQGCQEAVDEYNWIWSGQWKSILTDDEECVSIHSLPSCSDSSTNTQMILLNRSNPAAHAKLPLKLKSIKQCLQTESTRLFAVISFGGRLQLNDVSDCLSMNAKTSLVSRFHTYNGCLNIYQRKNCRGVYITISQGRTMREKFYWKSKYTKYEDNYAESVGQCQCDRRSTEARYNVQESTAVTLYDSVNDKNSNNATIDVDGCQLIPRILQRTIKKLTHKGHNTCIQLHEFWNCTGRSSYHGVLWREYHEIRRYGNNPLISTPHSSVLTWDGPFGSVSHCAYRCKISQSVRGHPNWNSSSLGQNIVTLFDEVNYNGNSVNVNLTDGCFEIRDEFPEWEGQVKSISIFDDCVTVYEKPYCTAFRDYGQMKLVIKNSEAGEMINFPVKSILRCNQELISIPVQPSGFFGYASNPEFKWLKTCISLTNITTGNIDASRTCLNVYEEGGCRGMYVAQMDEEKHINFFWKNIDGKRNRVGSIGPCGCDPRSEESKYANGSTLVRLYDPENNKVEVEVEGCKTIPKILQRKVQSVQFITQTHRCVELHQFWNCTGRSVQRGPDSRQRHVLKLNKQGINYTVPFADELDWMDGSVSSISKCDYGCRGSEMEESIPSSPGPSIVRIFEEPNFNGNSEDLNLSNGCFRISKEWEGQFQSIWLFYECVTMHSSPSCEKSSEYLPLNYSNAKDQAQISVTWTVRSITLCQDEESFHIPETTNITVAVITPILALFLLTVTVGSVMFIRLRRRNDKLNDKEVQDFINGTSTPGPGDAGCDEVLGQNRPYDQSYEVPKELLNIDIGAPLGSGAFAVVYRGLAKRPGGTEEFVVAVKTVKPYSGIEYTRALLKEIKTMIYVGKQDRIVGLFGCCLLTGELFVMTELCENGSMEKFLRSNRESFVNLIENESPESDSPQMLNYERMEPISPNYFNTAHLMEWCLQIAEGMDYLATKKIVHGDLATRNVLLDINFNIKISDFGLSKQLYQYSQYVKKTQSPLPWKWLAIETLRSFTFSTESDVWAFGVTVWEIFSLGDTPFPERIWNQDFLDSLTDYGLRLSRPKTAPTDWYNVILECWRERPSDRITFSDLRIQIAEILQKYDPSRPIYMNI